MRSAKLRLASAVVVAAASIGAYAAVTAATAAAGPAHAAKAAPSIKRFNLNGHVMARSQDPRPR